jgi:hypothetical protein
MRKRYGMKRRHSRRVFRKHSLSHRRNHSGSNYGLRGGIRL